MLAYSKTIFILIYYGLIESVLKFNILKKPGAIMNSFLSAAKENNFVLPDYKNSNLSIIKDMANMRGSRTGKKEKKIFLLVDGLGYNLVKRVAEEGSVEFLKSYKFEKISTIYPSTTAAAFISIETGLTPSEHGVVGWNIYSKELGTIIAPFDDSPSFSNLVKLSKANIPDMLPQPKLFSVIANNRNFMILFDELLNIPLGNGINAFPLERYVMQSGMALKLREEVNKGRYDFIYAYYPWIDHIEHVYGHNSEIATNGTVLLLKEIEKVLLPVLEKSNYNLVITADHGHTIIKNWLKMDSKSKIMRYITSPPWGDTRIMFFNVIPGQEEALEKHVAEKYSEFAILEESDNVISTGIFGKKKVDERIRYRFGTHILMAKANAAFSYIYPQNTQTNNVDFVGTHSGLSKEEMEIPLIVL